MDTSFILKESTYKELKKHLYPGSNLEFAAIMFCHYGQGKAGFRLIVKDLILIPADKCNEQTSNYLSWAFSEYMTPEKIEQIDKEGLSVFTIHSHPNGYDRFSKTDDKNDKEMFHAINHWFDDGRPNGSAIMLPNGRIISRIVCNKEKFSPVQKVSVIGENIKIWQQYRKKDTIPSYGLRVSQTFGKGTFNLLRELKVGVVGCSGTGSIVVELLMRNCVGQLVLVDPDVVEEKNLNRIINAKKIDAEEKIYKVETLKKAILETGIDIQVDTYIKDTNNKEVIEALTDCDVIFGCVDSATGRYHLECIATAYFIPFFDIGVNLEADSKGGITHADVAAHYIHPESSSLIARGVYTIEQLTAEGWQKNDKDYYEKNRMAGYLEAVGEDQPAVISVNMQAACLGFNDFLARLHKFRLDDNSQFNIQRFQLVHGHYLNEKGEEESSPIFKKYLGMGEKSFLIQNLKRSKDNH
ncbi:MAG: ThiF family adenylyltransferase [Bdellovibrionales bacterium]|nr:ThiF family adenylyltransferase [Bdellovibrionales bacterium]